MTKIEHAPIAQHPTETRFSALSQRLNNALFPEVKQLFNSLPIDVQIEFKMGLDKVNRGNFFRVRGFPNAQRFRETDYEHTIAGEERLFSYFNIYPKLGETVNRSETQVAYGIHDSGEIHPTIGDVDPFGRTSRDEKRKRLEPWAAKKFILSKIPDEKIKEDVLFLYERYQENNPKDLEIQLARYIDKSQGTVDPARLVFNMKNATEEQKRKITEHLWFMIPRMVEPAINLLTYLPTEESREAIRRIVLADLGELKKYGPREVIETFEQGFSNAA